MSECDKCDRPVENQFHHDAIYHPNKGNSDEASGYTKQTDRPDVKALNEEWY